MKAMLLLMTFSLVWNNNELQAKTLIVSDIDDTIKVTDVLNSKTEIVRNALFSKKAFSGMGQLYSELNQKDTRIHYVSGSPTVIRPIVTNFLGHNEFPQEGNLVLKKGSIHTYDYKVAAIKNIIALEQPDEIILIGDDTEVDPEVYDRISKLNPLKVSGIYIRAVKNRALPSNGLTRNFFASVEIAGVEHLKGRLSSAAVSKVTKSFIDQDKKSELAINKRYCPKDGRLEIEELKQRVSDQRTIDDMEKTQEKIIQTCSKA